jgi:hypothetical protein
MAIRQLSIFLENRKGRLAAITSILAGANIDIAGISIADTAEFGIIRLIVDDVEKAVAILKENNVLHRIDDVTAVEVNRKPGGLAKVLSLIDSTDINVEYMYTLATPSNGNPVLILRFSEPSVARDTLRKGGVILLDEKVIGIA